MLLDTHAFLWWMAGDAKLSLPARHAIDDAGNAIFVSAASAWEIATKVRIGKLSGAAAIAADLAAVLASQGFIAHCQSASCMGRQPGRFLARIKIRLIEC